MLICPPRKKPHCIICQFFRLIQYTHFGYERFNDIVRGFIELFPLAKSKHAKEAMFKFEKDSDMS